jgi:hypothetical protein
MTVETSALYRLERMLGLHKGREVRALWRRYVAALALLRARQAWGLTSWQVWLSDHRKALGATLGPNRVRGQYRAVLRNVRASRTSQTPQAQAERAATNAGYDEADRRRELLATKRRADETRWAVPAETPRLVVMIVVVVASIAAWVAFALADLPDGVATGWVGMLWVAAPIAASLSTYVLWLRAFAEARRHRRQADRLRYAATDYDKAWHTLRDAERLAGIEWGVSRVVCPRGMPDSALSTLAGRPSDELLAVPLPDLIDTEALRLADDSTPNVEAMRAVYRRKAAAGDRARRTWPSGTVVVPAEHAGAFSLGDYNTVRERADALHGGR